MSASATQGGHNYHTSAGQLNTQYIEWRDVKVICGHITSSTLWGNTTYCIKLSGEELSRYCLSNALDRPSNQFFPSVSLSVCGCSVVERFFTNFHQILHADQKCGRFVANCLWDQTGSSLPILELCGFRFRQFSGSGDYIFNRSAPNPIYR